MVIREIKGHMPASLSAGAPCCRTTCTVGLRSPSAGTAPGPTSQSLLSVSGISLLNLSKILSLEQNLPSAYCFNSALGYARISEYMLLYVVILLLIKQQT